MIRIGRYIPLYLVEAYYVQGWRITIFETAPHRHYAALAVLDT